MVAVRERLWDAIEDDKAWVRWLHATSSPAVRTMRRKLENRWISYVLSHDWDRADTLFELIWPGLSE